MEIFPFEHFNPVAGMDLFQLRMPCKVAPAASDNVLKNGGSKLLPPRIRRGSVGGRKISHMIDCLLDCKSKMISTRTNKFNTRNCE